MQLRSEVEAAVRSWDAYERNRGSMPVIDYDCHPVGRPVDAATSRLDVLMRLEELDTTEETVPGAARVRARLRGDVAYLRALLGERAGMRDYISHTQGCQAEVWPSHYVTARGAKARAAVDSIGIGWNADTLTE